jgi:hypothetical protein
MPSKALDIDDLAFGISQPNLIEPASRTAFDRSHERSESDERWRRESHEAAAARVHEQRVFSENVSPRAPASRDPRHDNGRISLTTVK